MSLHRCLAVLATLLIALCALPARAQNAVTLYGGYAWGGSFEQTGDTASTADLGSSAAGAAALDWKLDAARNMQLFASFQRATMDLPPGAVAPGGPNAVSLNLSYLHIGGSNFFEGVAGRGAYLAGGLGATFMSPGSDGLSSEVRPSLSIALGYEYMVNPSLALRAELRGFATLINSNGGFFCSGGCVVALQGDALVQGQALLGLSLRY